MQQSKELTPSPEQATEVTADVTTQASRPAARRRKAPVTVPISAALPAEATADLKGAHLPPEETVTSAKSTQTATSLRTLSAMHPQLRSASGSYAKPATVKPATVKPATQPRQKSALAAPPPTAPAPR